MLLFAENVEDMADRDNVAGIYLPPGAKADDDQTSKFLGAEEDEDLLNLEDDLDQLLSDVIKGPDKTKPGPRAGDGSGQTGRPTPAARTGAPGKAPPKPAPRKTQTPGVTTGRTETGKPADSTAATAMDDGDILKYIQDNAADSEASLDLF